jgi:hypothetical protein
MQCARLAMRARPRLESDAIVACLLAFVALEGAAMWLYPGGTWWARQAHGHRFWQNFLCDLEWRVALNGEPNRGAPLAQAAMLVLALALVPLWSAVARLFSRYPGTGNAVRVLGTVSVIAIWAVVLMPSDRYGAVHGLAVLTAGPLGLGAAGLAVVALAMGEPKPRVAAAAGMATLALAFADFVLFALHVWGHTEGKPAVAAMQKLALIFLLVWMLVVAARVRRL